MEALINLLDIVRSGADTVRAFVATNSLAVCDADGTTLAAIFPCHPDFPNAMPEAGGPFGYTLKIAEAFSETIYSLPTSSAYRGLRIVGRVPCLTLEIHTTGASVTTNVQELSRALSPWLVATEAQRQAAFATLSGKFELPTPLPPRQPLESRVLGRIEPGDLNDRKNWSLAIPHFGNLAVPVSLNEAGTAAMIVPEDVELLDTLLERFLGLGANERSSAAVQVLANCRDFLDAVGVNDARAERMMAITDPAQIWDYVSNPMLYVLKDIRHGSPPFFMLLLCDCAWDEEHGLQLVYRNGDELLRVSGQDLGVT